MRSTSTPTTWLVPGVRRWTLILGIATLVQGAWAYLAPANFYAGFPVPDAEWVSTLGEFNDHLSRDFGSALMGLGVAALLAGIYDSVPAARVTMVGYVVFGVPHLIFHLTTFEEFSASSFTIQITALALFIAVPLRLLVALRRDPNTKGTTP